MRRLQGRRAGLARWTLAALLVVAGVLVGGFFWVRQSSLVAVQQVSVTGVSGPDAAAIRETLAETAERMTTLDVDDARLRASVARYPVVRSVHVRAHLPHRLTISVFEQIPIAVLQSAGGQTTVSSRGTLLHGGDAGGGPLPVIRAALPAHGTTVTGSAAADVALLAAAPYPIIARVASAGWEPGDGFTVTLRRGPAIYFGDATQLAGKWTAAIAALADPMSDGASYIDVSDPAHPAAGIGHDTASSDAAAAAGASGSQTATTSATTGNSTTN